MKKATPTTPNPPFLPNTVVRYREGATKGKFLKSKLRTGVVVSRSRHEGYANVLWEGTKGPRPEMDCMLISINQHKLQRESPGYYGC